MLYQETTQIRQGDRCSRIQQHICNVNCNAETSASRRQRREYCCGNQSDAQDEYESRTHSPRHELRRSPAPQCHARRCAHRGNNGRRRRVAITITVFLLAADSIHVADAQRAHQQGLRYEWQRKPKHDYRHKRRRKHHGLHAGGRSAGKCELHVSLLHSATHVLHHNGCRRGCR